jgi:hypothetical protein
MTITHSDKVKYGKFVNKYYNAFNHDDVKAYIHSEIYYHQEFIHFQITLYEREYDHRELNENEINFYHKLLVEIEKESFMRYVNELYLTAHKTAPTECLFDIIIDKYLPNEYENVKKFMVFFMERSGNPDICRILKEGLEYVICKKKNNDIIYNE